MPAYNAERTISAAIDSILLQTFQDFEIIICDDASTDGTRDIIKCYSDVRIVYINNIYNLGSGLSKDRAIEFASGEWVAFTDADDTWLAGRLETLLANVNNQEDVMLFDDIIECHDTPDGLVPWRVIRGEDAFGLNKSNVPYEIFILSKRLVIQPLVRLNTIKNNNIYHSNRPYAEDTEFFIQLMAHGTKLRYVPKPLYQYRITPNSASSTKRRSTMMKEVLENAMPLFLDFPFVQAALRQKIETVTYDELYMPFLVSLKQRQFISAIKMLYQSPWLVIEFLSRVTESAQYHLHRVWHGGQVRGIR